MSYPNNNTNQNSTQPPRAAIGAAESQHWGDLSQVALYQHYLVTNQMKPPPALPVGCLADEYLAECLLSHLRAEFHDIEWPETWDDLKDRDIPGEMGVKLHFVARRRTFKGVCEICKGWYQDDALPTRQVVEAFLESNKGKIRENSLKSYRSCFSPFVREFPYLPTAEEIDQYLARYPKGAYSTYLKLHVLFTFASKKYKTPNVIDEVKRPKETADIKVPLSLEEAKASHKACQNDRELGLIQLYLDHAFRLAEATRLNVGAIGDGVIFITGKERNEPFPLLPETREICLRLANGRKPEEPLFLSQQKRRLCDKQAYNNVKEVLARAGINRKASPHLLRHSFATLTTDAGLDKGDCARLMRHSQNSMTDRYIHLNLAHLRRQLEIYSPIRLIQRNDEQIAEKPKLW